MFPGRRSKGTPLANGAAWGKGRIRGKAESLLTFLAARGLAVSEDQRDFILSCSDADRFDVWLREAAMAASTAEILDR